MIIAETALALSVICTLPRRRPCFGDDAAERIPYILTTDRPRVSFQVASGVSLEHKLTKDIQEIAGVDGVTIRRMGASYQVSVIMGTFAFESYEKVIQKELELFDALPGLDFVFNVEF